MASATLEGYEDEDPLMGCEEEDPLAGYEDDDEVDEEDPLAGYEDGSGDDSYLGDLQDSEDEETDRLRAVRRRARRMREEVYDEDEHSAFWTFHDGHGPPVFGVQSPLVGEEGDGDGDGDGKEEKWVTAGERLAREETEVDEEEEREDDEQQSTAEMTTLNKRVEYINIKAEETTRRTWRENLARKRKEGRFAMGILALKIWHHEKTVKSALYYQKKEEAEEIRRRSRAREHQYRMDKWQVEEERMRREHRHLRYSNAYMEYQRYVSDGRAELDRQLYGYQLRTKPSESVMEREGKKRQETEDAEREGNAKEARRLGRLRRKIEKETQDRVREAQMVFKRAAKRERCEEWKNQLAYLQTAANERKDSKKAEIEAKEQARREQATEAIRLFHERQRIYETARLEREKAKREEKERTKMQKRAEKEERARRWEADEREREEQRRKSGNASSGHFFMITTVLL